MVVNDSNPYTLVDCFLIYKTSCLFFYKYKIAKKVIVLFSFILSLSTACAFCIVRCVHISLGNRKCSLIVISNDSADCSPYVWSATLVFVLFVLVMVRGQRA